MTLAGRFELPGDTSELTLELARRSHEPAAADRARNLAALRSRLGLPVPAGGPVAGGPVATGPVAGGAVSPLAAAPPRALRLAPWQQLVAVGVVTGAVGFFLGLGVSERANTVESAASPATSTSLQHALAPSPARLDRQAPSEPIPSEPPPAEHNVAQPTAAQASVTEPIGAAAPARTAMVAPRAARARRAPPARATVAAAAERSDPELLEAVRLLARARRALDRQEPALALGLLDELDARFARELLDEERAATRVLGLCASGERASAFALARSWFAERPRSIYRRRLEQSCARDALRR